MLCRTYELKIDKSHCSVEALAALNRVFLEAKWFYNQAVSLLKNGYNMNYKTIDVEVKRPDGEFETRHITKLSSQMRQGVIEQMRCNLRSLSGQERSGHKVGSLRFASRIAAIPLTQYGSTHRIVGKRLKIQGMKQPFMVRGTEQIPIDAELTSGRLMRRGGDFFLHLICFVSRPAGKSPRPSIGADSGIRHQFVFSNGVALGISIPMTKRAKRLHRELTRRRTLGKNWYKSKDELKKEFCRMTNRRLDVRHKVVSYLTSTYGCVATQKDTVSGWQRLWGRRILSTAVGGIMSDLRTKPRTPLVVDRFVPTTRWCSECGRTNEIGLGERVYTCSACGLAIDRDLNAATNTWLQIPVERRESTPVDTKAATEMVGYLNSIPYVSASLVEEAGSHPNRPRG